MSEQVEQAGLSEEKHFLEKAFEVLTEHVKDVIKNHDVLPHRISVPYHENGKWIRVSMDMSPIRKEVEEKA